MEPSATRGIVLIDGQHYPPVTERAIAQLRADGVDVVAAVFLGGTEKTEAAPRLDIPVFDGSPAPELVERALTLEPDELIDLSDEPVLDHRMRFRLAGIALRGGVSYRGAGYRFDPPHPLTAATRPAVTVSGTGKRTGKTAAAIELARFWRDAGDAVAMVTMGRGGPEEPTLLRSGEFEATADGLLRLAARGFHAASDYVEDALFAQVDTIGTWRCGAGPAGVTDRHNFAAGVALAESLQPDLLLYEGSGTAIPPTPADRHLLVMPATIDPEYLTGYFGTYRLALADAVLVMGPEGHDRAETHEAVRRVDTDLPIFDGHYEADVTAPVAGRRVVVITTAPHTAAPFIRLQLESQGADAVSTVHSLSDRARLRADLDSVTDTDMAVVEIKAAAVDSVIPWALDRGVEVAFLHNRVVVEGGLSGLAVELDPRQATTS